jgi:hypothetical protein
MQNLFFAVRQQIKHNLKNFFNLIKLNWKIIFFKHIPQALLSIVLEYLLRLIF